MRLSLHGLERRFSQGCASQRPYCCGRSAAVSACNQSCADTQGATARASTLPLLHLRTEAAQRKALLLSPCHATMLIGLKWSCLKDIGSLWCVLALKKLSACTVTPPHFHRGIAPASCVESVHSGAYTGATAVGASASRRTDPSLRFLAQHKYRTCRLQLDADPSLQGLIDLRPSPLALVDDIETVRNACSLPLNAMATGKRRQKTHSASRQSSSLSREIPAAAGALSAVYPPFQGRPLVRRGAEGNWVSVERKSRPTQLCKHRCKVVGVAAPVRMTRAPRCLVFPEHSSVRQRRSVGEVSPGYA